MDEDKFAYCQYTEIKLKKGDVVTWCNKYNMRVFKNDIVLCNTCQVFEYNNERKNRYIQNWAVIPKSKKYNKISVFTGNEFINNVIIKE